MNKFGMKEALDFMKRRWYRTLPNYYLFFIIMLFFQWNIGENNFWSFLFFTQNLFVKPIAGFYGVSWSLTIEEIFYVTFPFTLILIGFFVKKTNRKLLLTIAIFIIAPLALRLIAYSGTEFSPGDYRKAAVIRLDSIAYGVLAAYLKIHFPIFWSKIQKQGLLTLLPFWYLFIYRGFPSLSIEHWNAVFFPLCSICMALTMPFFDSIKTNSSIFSKPISFIAEISYSLYLCHIPVIIIANRYFNIKHYLNGYALEFFYVITIILFAYIVNRAWEKPMTKLRDKKSDQPRS